MLNKTWLFLIIFLFLNCKDSDQRKLAPDFNLDNLQGDRIYLSEQLGKTVLLNFWSVHCIPCFQEMPELEKIWETNKKNKFLILGISTDPKEADYLDAIIKKGIKITYPILSDRNGKVQKLYGVSVLPTSILISSTGKILKTFVGYSDSSFLEMKIILKDLKLNV